VDSKVPADRRTIRPEIEGCCSSSSSRVAAGALQWQLATDKTKGEGGLKHLCHNKRTAAMQCTLSVAIFVGADVQK